MSLSAFMGRALEAIEDKPREVGAESASAATLRPLKSIVDGEETHGLCGVRAHGKSAGKGLPELWRTEAHRAPLATSVSTVRIRTKGYTTMSIITEPDCSK